MTWRIIFKCWRKLRNDAAHSAEHMDLSSSPHIERIIHLNSLTAKSPIESALDPPLHRAVDDPSGSLFRSLVIGVFNLQAAANAIEPFNISTVYSLNFVRPPDMAEN